MKITKKQVISSLEEIKKYIQEIEKPVPSRWRAEEDEQYYYANAYGGSVTRDIYSGGDDFLYQSGNYFQTKEEAEQRYAVQKALNNIREYRERVLRKWKPDWEDPNKIKYSLSCHNGAWTWAETEDHNTFNVFGYFWRGSQIDSLIDDHKSDLEIIRKWYESHNCIF
jgi:hypothetical protein